MTMTETPIEVPTADTEWGKLDALLGNASGCKVARNTYARRQNDDNFGPIIVRLHETDIATCYVDGSVMLYSGGWRTVTTKERMNRYLPGFTLPDGTRVNVTLSADRGTWKVSRSWWRDVKTEADPWGYEHGGETVSDYYDGMVIAADGSMVTPAEHNPGDRDREVKRAIKKYVALYTDEKIAELVADAAENGTTGDCWFCSMRVTGTGETLGDAQGDDEHLREHLREGYVMASLARNAIEARGYREPAVIFYHAPDLVRQSIRKYLTQRLAVNTTGATPTGQNYGATHEGGPWS